MKLMHAFILILSCALTIAGQNEDLGSLCMARAAIERIYYSHRLGTSKPFEQAMPRELIEKLVRQDFHKKATLKKVYGVEISPAMIAAEAQRIESTTHAPEVLLEIKHALGDDPERFALSMARPIVVERTLRARFENDDKIHALQRREAERARERLLAKKPVKNMQEITWQLTARPVVAGGADPGLSMPTQPSPGSAPPATISSVSYSVEATAQIAQTLASPGEPDRKFYFEDLEPELQKVLRVQLQKPGDVSAVIETSSAFLLFIAKARNAETLSVASLSIPKRSYEEWLAEQSD
jgi:hypothetical protein